MFTFRTLARAEDDPVWIYHQNDLKTVGVSRGPRLTGRQVQHLMKPDESKYKNAIEAKTLVCGQENRFKGGIFALPDVQQAIRVDFGQC